MSVADEVTADEMRTWTSIQVKNWLIKKLHLEDDDAQKILNQKIDGETFLDLDKLDLESYGLVAGPVKKILKVIAKFDLPSACLALCLCITIL